MSKKLALLCCLVLQISLAVVLLTKCSAANPTGEIAKEQQGVNFATNQTKPRITRFARGQVNGQVNVDVNDFADKIQTWIRHSKPGERRGFVKGLLEKAKFLAPDGYHVMVYNLNQEYANGLRGVYAYTDAHEYDAHWGIWVFKCGTFMNKGERGWENWAFTLSDYGKKFANGNGAIFAHSECDHPAYRPFNHHIVWNKDYPGSDIRVFHDVETREECMAWTIEIDGNVAVYREDQRKCYAKESHYGRGITYNKWGHRLGDYDVNAFDVEEANGWRKQEWFREAKCDVVHSNIPPDDRHYCKVFSHCQACLLMFRARN